MKKLLLILPFIYCLNLQAQYVKVTYDRGKCGYSLLNDDMKETFNMPASFEKLMFYVEVSVAGRGLGNHYLNSTFWNDTEFVETPYDPNDPSLTKTDTIVNDTKKLVAGKLFFGQKNKQWRMYRLNGKVVNENSYSLIEPFKLKRVGEADSLSPMMMALTDKGVVVLDQQGNQAMTSDVMSKYYPFNTINTNIHLLELIYFNNQLLVQRNGKVVDSLIQVKQKVSMVKMKGKKNLQKVVEPGYSYTVAFYRGGEFNVLNLGTGELMWKDWQKGATVELKSGPELKLLDVTNFGSMQQLQKNWNYWTGKPVEARFPL